MAHETVGGVEAEEDAGEEEEDDEEVCDGKRLGEILEAGAPIDWGCNWSGGLRADRWDGCDERERGWWRSVGE